MGAYFELGSQRFPLRDGISTIGRDSSCDIHILDQGLSRQHAIVVKDVEGYVLFDLKSRNGVEINGRKVDRHSLAPGDRIRLGQQEARFGLDSEFESFRQERSNLFGLLTQQVELSEEQVSLLRGGERAHSDTLAKLMTLYQVGKVINSELDLGALLEKVMDKALEVISADRGLILLLDAASGELEVKTSRQMTPQDGDSAISQSIARDVVKTGKPILTADAMTDKRFEAAMSIQALNIRSAICVPLQSRQKLIGVLYVDNRMQSHSFKEDDLCLSQAFADQAAIAVENARLYASIQEETRKRTNLQRYLSPSVVEKVLTSHEDIGREKLTASVLFSDIRNFTMYAEDHGPEEVVGILNEYLDRMTQVVFQHQGTLDKYMGDGILAVFGAPFALADSPFQAVKAALQMQEEMKELNAAWRQRGVQPHEIGIAVHTGELIAGNIGSKDRVDYTVIGDTVNTTSRLQGLAEGGQVVVSEETFQHVKDRVEAAPQESVSVKGKKEKIRIYRVTALKSADTKPVNLNPAL